VKKNPNSPVIIKDNFMDKIMNFDLNTIMQNIADLNENQLRKHIKDFLAEFDTKNECESKEAPSFVTKENNPTQQGPCNLNGNMYSSLKHQGIESRRWDLTNDPTIKLYTTTDTPFNTINMCSSVDMDFFGRNGVDIDNDAVEIDSKNTGGRCTLKDISLHGGGDDFNGNFITHVPVPASLNTQACNTVGDSCDSKCNIPEFKNTPQWDGITRTSLPLTYAGQQYVTPSTKSLFSQQRQRGLCHRVDSGCVTRHNLQNIQQIFGVNPPSAIKNPVDIKLNTRI